MQNIIDLQFRESKTFFLWLSFIYIITFVVPYIIYATMADFGLSSRNTTPLIAVCCLGQILFTLIEITYLYQLGFLKYLSIANINQISQLIVFAFNVKLIEEAKTYEDIAEGEHDDRLNWRVMLEVLIIFQVALKLQSFLNLNEKYSLISQIVVITLHDMVTIILYFFFFVAFFACVFLVLRCDPGTS